MKNCFNQILIGLNITDSLHIVFAILDGIRNNFEGSYPTFLMRIFPYFHYPFYRYISYIYGSKRKILSLYISLFWLWEESIEVLQNSHIGTIVHLIKTVKRVVKDFLTLFNRKKYKRFYSFLASTSLSILIF